MTTSSYITRWISPLLILLSGFLVFIVFNSHPWTAVDDAFITYRYADNLRNGFGFVYNHGESVLGTTTPLFGLLLGVIGLFLPGVEMAAIGFWVAGFTWIASAWFAAFFFLGLDKPIAALVAGVFVAVQPLMLSHLGMETSLVILLMLASAWAWQQEQWVWAIVVSALLILTRQDGALWVLLLGAEEWRRNRQIPWRQALATTAFTLPWLLFSWWQYGSILPNSVLAKTGQVARMSVSGGSSILERFWLFLSGGHDLPYALMLMAVVVVGVVFVLFHQRQLWWLSIWVVFYLTIYHLLGVISFVWYFLPPLVVISLLAAIGFDTLFNCARSPTGYLHWSVVIPLLIALGFLVFNRAERVLIERIHLDRTDPKLHPYHATSLWLANNAEPSGRVATIEIGAIGYHISNPILDTMGLVSPEMQPYLTGWSDSLAYAITGNWPEYVVTLPNTAWDSIVPQWWFGRYYTQVAQFDDVSIYQRHSLPTRTVEYNFHSTDIKHTGFSLAGAAFDGQYLKQKQSVDGLLALHVTQKQITDLQFAFRWCDTTEGCPEQEMIWTYFMDGVWPVPHWPVGRTISMPIRVNVPEELKDGDYWLEFVVRRLSDGHVVPLENAPSSDSSNVQIGSFWIGDPPAPSELNDISIHKVQTKWQDGIELISLGIPNHSLHAGDALVLQFNWTTDTVIGRDLTAFVHVLDDTSNSIVAQNDQKPFGGDYPTTVWRIGEQLVDTLVIMLPPYISPGTYGLRVGLYDAAGRLTLQQGEYDSLLLQEVLTIQSSR